MIFSKKFNQGRIFSLPWLLLVILSSKQQSMKYKNSQEFLKRLSNLFNGLLAFPLLLVGFGYLEVSSGSWVAMMESSNSLVFSMIAGLGIISTWLSLRFKRESRKLTLLPTIHDKMDAYFMLASFYYWSAFGLSIISAVMLFVVADVAFAVVYAYILFWMSLFRPTLRSLADLFGLKDEEKKGFLNKEDFKK